MLLGVVSALVLWRVHPKPWQREQQFPEWLERPLRKAHLLASNDYYRALSKAMTVPFLALLIVGGAVMISIGLLR